jgi:hypothetical protein
MSRSASFKDQQQNDEYDPELDGQTVVGSSRSEEERGKLLPRELIPAE